jgi:tetratricopeptide (TPR) repeat protein
MKPAAALEAVETAMRLDPRKGDRYLFDRGCAYTLLGRRKEAIPDFKRYLVLHPDHFMSHAFLGNNYSFLGDEDDARTEAAAVERAIAANPNHPLGYALADLLNSLGKPAEALLVVDKVTRVDAHGRVDFPEWSWYEQGSAFTLLGRPEEAILAFKRYLARYPDNFWAHAYLAVDYMEVGHPDASGRRRRKL